MNSRLVLVVAVLAVAGCRGRHHRAAVENEEPDAVYRLSSNVKMNDASARPQLLKGFSGIEAGAWRWTAGKFTVQLKPPLASGDKGATLKLAFTVPEAINQKLGAITLTASVAGAPLKSETYAKAGPYTFTADVPPGALMRDSVTVDFALDKFIPAGTGGDARELGIIAASVSLETK